MATRFCKTFGTFSHPEHKEERVKHLVEVLSSALRFALWLYSQPATFGFLWGPASDGSRSGQTVVTVPSMVKLYDDMGSKVNPPQPIQGLVRKRV